MRLSAKKINRSNGGTAVILFFLFLLSLLMVVPLVYALLQSLKPIEEIFVYPPRFWVKRPTADNFASIFRSAGDLWVPFSRYVFNSLFIAGVSTAIQVIFASMAAYPLAKHRFKGQNFLFNLVMIALLFTGEVLFLPQYLLVSLLGIVDSYWGLILPSMAYPLGLYLMRQNMLSFPDSILEAARMDGAAERYTFWKIVMPNMKAPLMTMIVFAFSAMWSRSDATLIYSEELKSLPTLLSQLSSAGIARAGMAAASTVLLMIPPIIVFILTQSQVIEAMTNSGIKE